MLPEWMKEIVQRRDAARTAQILSRVAKTTLHMRLGGGRYHQAVYHPTLVEALGTRPRPHHISDHLGTLFFFALDARPRLMVELGTRAGESTRTLLAAAALTGATLLSIDLNDCGQLDLPGKQHWRFVQSDDVAFGRDGFVNWCQGAQLAPCIDFLFIDTSHHYEHTKQEIEVWLPHLAEQATVVFHDTNMGNGPYARLDGSSGYSYDNQRGVIRAVEELVGRQYDERTFFTDLVGGYLIMHHPNCAGLTVLRRMAATR